MTGITSVSLEGDSQGGGYLSLNSYKINGTQVTIWAYITFAPGDNWETDNVSMAIVCTREGQNDGPKFRVLEDGSLYAGAADITGTITATRGMIGGTSNGWSIGTGVLSSGSTYLYSTDQTSGTTVGNSGSLKSWRLLVGSQFGVTSDGSLYAGAADITGIIHADSGEIGAFEITNDGLSSDYITLNSQSIYFPTQASFNLANYVGIYHDATSNVSYISTSGDRDFEIRNMGGAGIRFKADGVNEQVTQTITLRSGGTQSTGAMYGFEVPLIYTISNGGTLLMPYETKIYYTIGSDTKSLSVTIPAGSNTGTCSSKIVHPGGGTYKEFKGISLYSSGTPVSSVTWTTVSINTTNNILYSLGSFCPQTTATASTGYLLGDADHLWRNLTAYSATITTSDRNEKHDIKILSDEFDGFYDELRPVSFIYNQSDSNRTHLGFIAQDVEDNLVRHHIDTKNFAGICIDENKETGNKKYFLRYEEFIPLNTLEIQKLKARVAELENKIALLTGEN